MIEREKFIVRQPPIGEKNNNEFGNSWISDARMRDVNSAATETVSR